MNAILDFLKKATNVQFVLDAMRSGKVIRTTLSYALRIGACVLGLLYLWYWIKFWRLMGSLSAVAGIGFLIWQLFALYTAFLVLKVLYLRAAELIGYPLSDYVVVPIVAVLLKTVGEMAFIGFAVMSIPTMLFVWTAGSRALVLPGYYFASSTFMSGIRVFILFWISGFAILLFTQLIAEWSLALFSIAHDVNITRRRFALLIKKLRTKRAPA
jgi:hypothetical protein